MKIEFGARSDPWPLTEVYVKSYLSELFPKEAAIDRKLLERVVSHKEIFFRSGWANYSTAKPGSLRLSPRAEQLAALQDDYSKMQEMFFEESETFAKILERISKFEELINS